MRTFKLTIAYDGTAYAGWQVQPERQTVQGVLEKAVASIVGQSVRITASGRTDAGVHALGQVVSFSAETGLPVEVLQRAVNAQTPADVAVLEATEVAAGFHPIRDAVSKRYRYVIRDGTVPDVFDRQYCWHYRHGRLDDKRMARAAEALLGKHDFSSFESSGAPRQSSVRTVSHISIRRSNAEQGRAGVVKKGTGSAASCIFGQLKSLLVAVPVPFFSMFSSVQGRAGGGDRIVIEIEADGFLYNMVRAIVGTLVEVGRGAQTETWPAEALNKTDRRAAGPTAPAQGLFLVKVDYSQNESY